MYSLKSIVLQKSELAMDELVGVATAVIALKYYVSAMSQINLGSNPQPILQPVTHI